MIYIVKNSQGDPIYKITPYNDLCYTLYKWDYIRPNRPGEGDPHWDWKHTGKYPTSLAQAFGLIQDLMLLEDTPTILIDRKEVVDNFEELKAIMKHNCQQIRKAIVCSQEV